MFTWMGCEYFNLLGIIWDNWLLDWLEWMWRDTYYFSSCCSNGFKIRFHGLFPNVKPLWYGILVFIRYRGCIFVGFNMILVLDNFVKVQDSWPHYFSEQIGDRQYITKYFSKNTGKIVGVDTNSCMDNI